MLSFLDPVVTLLHVALLHLSTVMPGSRSVQVVLALVLLSLLVRTALLPLAMRGCRAQKAREKLAPELARLQKRHGKDRAKLATEITAAHKRAGLSPMAGMGASLAQAPALMASYRLVMAPVIAGHANVLTTVTLLGTPMSVHWVPVLSTAGLISAPALLCFVMMLGLVAVAALQSRQTVGGPTLLRLMPFGSVAWAFVAPVGFSIYLLTSTSWTLAERTFLPRLVGA